jgi:hypothetical protein
MTDHDVHGCGRAGSAIGVFCALLGLVCACMMLVGLFKMSLTASDIMPILAVGVIGLFVGAGFFGKKAGVFLCQRGNKLSTNILVGIALAFGSIATAILTGTLAAPVLAGNLMIDQGVLVFGFIVFLYTVSFGGIPATLLGILFGILMRSQLRPLNTWTSSKR